MRETIIVNDPYTGETVFTAESEPFAACTAKIDKAQAASRRWSALAPAARAAAVREALGYFTNERDAIALGITRETGKPLAAATEELEFMIERAAFLCRFAEAGCLAPVDLSAFGDAAFEGRIEYRAKGVVYIISPWNYPLFCAINGTVCALLAGNAVLLKHTTAPSVGRHFARAFGTLHGIEHLVQDVIVDFATSAEIIEKGAIDHVIFTGSVRGGRDIAASVARRVANEVPNPFIQYSLELGSNDAAYIAADADLNHAVDWVVKIGRLHNSGQSCCAVKRVYVHETLHDEFVARAAKVMAGEVLGDPHDPATTLGPLRSGQQAVEALAAIVADAAAAGAEIVTGGTTRMIGPALFLTPTLLAKTNHSMRVMREETFGPVLPVMQVADDKQAVQLIADTKYGLTASIFTRSRARAEAFIAAVGSGTIYVNRCNFVDARLGWIGHRRSGNGAISLSPLGILAMSRLHSINIDPGMLE